MVKNTSACDMNSRKKVHRSNSGLSEKIENSARSVIKKYHTRDPFAICSRKNISVEYSDIGSLKGFYTEIRRNHFIVINESISETDAKTVCAHELGHFCLHKNLENSRCFREFSLYDMQSRPEYEANLFAAHLLIDENMIRSLAHGGYSVDQIANEIKCDRNLVVIKLHEMARSEKNISESAFTEFPRADFLKDRWDGINMHKH